MPLATRFSQQVQSALAVHHSATKLLDKEPTKNAPADATANSTRRWHLARHVFRSGLIFGPMRRASDSIVPLLLKAHDIRVRARTASIDSTLMGSSFANFIDYLARKADDDTCNDSPRISIMKRSRSDTSTCIERNRLTDMIAQYETMIRQLDNYSKFTVEHPLQAPTMDVSQEGEGVRAWTTAGPRQTQSLARHAGRNFTEFILNDLLLSAKSAESERRCGSTAHTASQTDLWNMGEAESDEPADEKEIVPTLIGREEPPLMPSNIQVVVTDPSVEPAEQPLIARLFEGKKAAFTLDGIHMETMRLSKFSYAFHASFFVSPDDELLQTFTIAKTKCFFPSETILVSRIDGCPCRRTTRIV